MPDATTFLEIANSGINFLATQAPTIITAYGTAFVAWLFMRGNTSKSELAKLQAADFREISKKMLDNRDINHLEYYKLNNFAKIAQKADEIYGESGPPPKEAQEFFKEFDFDWFMRFFEAASNVSDEDMQTLWARILAGEFREKESFSLRAIEILRNMAQWEAKRFRDVAKETVHFSAVGLCAINEVANIFFRSSAMYIFEEIGLMKRRSENRTYINFSNRNICVIAKRPSNNKDVKINYYTFTRVGAELLKTVKVETDDKWLFGLANWLDDRFSDVKVYKKNEFVEIDDDDDFHEDFDYENPISENTWKKYYHF